MVTTTTSNLRVNETYRRGNDNDLRGDETYRRGNDNDHRVNETYRRGNDNDRRVNETCRRGNDNDRRVNETYRMPEGERKTIGRIGHLVNYAVYAQQYFKTIMASTWVVCFKLFLLQNQVVHETLHN